MNFGLDFCCQVEIFSASSLSCQVIWLNPLGLNVLGLDLAEGVEFGKNCEMEKPTS